PCSSSASTPTYTLSLHDALPISPLDLRDAQRSSRLRFPACQWMLVDLTAVMGGLPGGATVGAVRGGSEASRAGQAGGEFGEAALDRKSTRLNSSHVKISYAVLCL